MISGLCVSESHIFFVFPFLFLDFPFSYRWLCGGGVKSHGDTGISLECNEEREHNVIVDRS